MRKLLNVLYVTNPDAYLSKDGETVKILVDNQVVARFPALNLEGIVCFGYMGASPRLMELCAQQGIGLSFVSESGKLLARMTGACSGNVLLRRTQYRLSDDPIKSAEIARAIVMGKVMNTRQVLLRFRRDYPERVGKGLNNALEEMARALKAMRQHEDLPLDAIRGWEGLSARLYFSCLGELILSQKEDFYFVERTRRPPMDLMNALLSFLYTLIAHDTASALEKVGLDPQVGFLHRDRPGRLSLALDIMEELRPYMGDRFALTLINNQMVQKNDFHQKENGAVLLTPDGRKTVLSAWQKRKKEVIIHPYLEEKVEIGLLPYVQALLMARFIRGDIDGYPPFLMR